VSATVERLSLEAFRALPIEERHRQWHATWNPWRSWYHGRAWSRLLELLADGDWHMANDLRPEMMAAGEIVWKTSYHLLYRGVRAEALEEHRLGGSPLLVDRRIRLRPDAPERLLRQPAWFGKDTQPNGCP
jgi:hypothetical protein